MLKNIKTTLETENSDVCLVFLVTCIKYVLYHYCRRSERNISQYDYGSGSTSQETINFNGSSEFSEEQLLTLYTDMVILADRIRLYGSIVIIPPGIILNILCFVIFYKIEKHKSALGLHMMCMAIADNCILLGILIMEDYGFIFGKSFRIQDFNMVFCRGAYIFFNAGPLLGGLLLASVTVERYCCIAFPLKVKTWNLTRLSKILNVLYFFASLNLNCDKKIILFLKI